MLKQFAFLVIFSILAILFMKYFNLILSYIIHAHHFIYSKLQVIFAGGHIGLIIRNSVALILIPTFASLIPSGAYWCVKRQQMPYAFHLVWITWILLATSIALHH